MGNMGPQVTHSSAVGGPTCLGDQMTVFGLPTTLYQGLGLSEDLFMTASLGSMCGGAGRGKMDSTPWGREHRDPREGLLNKGEKGAREDIVHLPVVLRPGLRQPASAVPSLSTRSSQAPPSWPPRTCRPLPNTP